MTRYAHYRPSVDRDLSRYISAVRVHHWVAVRYRSAVAACPPGGFGRQAELMLTDVGLTGGARDKGSDDIGGVPVQAAAGPVVPHRGPRIRVGGGLLHIAQRYPDVERGGDERVPERVRTDGLGDPGAARG